jgi:GAF domain-containing protein
MMEHPVAAVVRPVLQSIVRSALEATAATDGWIVSSLDEVLYIAAAAGPTADRLLGRQITNVAGSATFVIGSGQPVAISPRGDSDPLGRSVAELTGRRPTSILSVPCSTGSDVLGALELVDKAAGDRFSFDDLELVTLLAGIAAAALAETDRRPTERFSADSLADALRSLALSDPARFDSVAAVLAILLEHV